MLSEFKRKTNWGLFIGLVFAIIGWTVFKKGNVTAANGVPIAVAGWLVFSRGAANYARGKGHSGWWCIFALFFGVFGLIPLAFLKDHHEERSVPRSRFS